MMDKLAEFIRKEITSVIQAANQPPREVSAAPDETSLIKRADEGARARHFLESALFVDFMARSEAQLTTAMLECPLDNDAARRDLAVAIQTQRQWVRFLLASASDGRAAERELARLSSGRRDYF